MGADPARSFQGTAPASVCLTQRVLQWSPDPRASPRKEGHRDFWKNNCPLSPLNPSAPGEYLQLRGLVYYLIILPSGWAAEADCCFPLAGVRACSWTPV